MTTEIDIEKLADEIARKLEGYSTAVVGEPGDVLEKMGVDFGPGAGELALLRAIDRRVFCCADCGYWWKQDFNATPDDQNWYCKDCANG